MLLIASVIAHALPSEMLVFVIDVDEIADTKLAASGDDVPVLVPGTRRDEGSDRVVDAPGIWLCASTRLDTLVK